MKQNVCKICRRSGSKLFLKGERCLTAKCGFTRRSYAPGIHGQKRTSRLSDYGKQLREKQKARFTYGVSEEQFANYYKKANKSNKPTANVIMELLERRLDNVVYRLGLAPSRRAARQLVNHGITVNGKKVDIPSYSVRKNDLIIANAKQTKDKELPMWLSYNSKTKTGKVESMPEKDMMDNNIESQLIVEYYSK